MAKDKRFDVAPEHIRRHYLPDDHLCVVRIERSTGRVEQEIRTAAQIASDEYQAMLRASNAHGKDIYVTVNTVKPDATGRTKADIDQVRHVYMDIDEGGKPALNRVLATKDLPPPHRVMETSPGKFQALWQVEGFDKTRAEKLTRGLAIEHGADEAVWDTARVLRIPGFRNCKYDDPHYVRIHDTAPSVVEVYRPESFPARYAERGAERDSQRIEFGSRPSASKVQSGAGSQSERDYAYAMRRLEKGDDPQSIERKIADFRRERGDKAYPDSYAKRTVRAAAAHFVSRPVTSVASAHDDREGRSR